MARALLWSLLISFFAWPVHAQTDYEVKLFRPGKTGDRYRVSATGHQIREVALRSDTGETLKSQREMFSVEMSGAVEVLETDPKGNVTRASITVDKLVRIVGSQRDELLMPGTKVIERRVGPRQDFQIEGTLLTPELKDALDVAFSETNDPAAPSDDELMGTSARKKVGERWQVNRDRMAGFFSQDTDVDLAIAPGDIEGTGAITGLSRVEGVECMRIEVGMVILGSPKHSKLPPGVEKARIEVRLSALVPVDPRLDALEESTQLTMSLGAPASAPREGRGPDQLITTWEQRSDRKLRPAKQ